jgi:hypothetical protein
VLRKVPKDGQPSPTGTVEVRLDREGATDWKVTSSHGYPANPLRVQGLLEALASARRKAIVTEREDTFADYATNEGWVHVDVLGAGDRALAAFDLGKTAGWPDAYVRMQVGDRPAIVRAFNLTPDKARVATDAWLDAAVWPGLTLPDAQRIDVFQAEEQQTLSFERVEAQRPADGEPPPAEPAASTWKMRAPKEAEAETMPVENLVRTFTGLRFVEVADKVAGADAEAKYGFDKPSYRVVLVSAPKPPATEPVRSVLEVGRRVEAGEPGVPAGTDAWYARRQGEGWVFTVRATAIGEFRKGASDFLPKPPEPPPGEATPPKDGDGAGDDAPPNDGDR